MSLVWAMIIAALIGPTPWMNPMRRPDSEPNAGTVRPDGRFSAVSIPSTHALRAKGAECLEPRSGVPWRRFRDHRDHS
jgi:hypothetical protein